MTEHEDLATRCPVCDSMFISGRIATDYEVEFSMDANKDGLLEDKICKECAKKAPKLEEVEIHENKPVRPPVKARMVVDGERPDIRAATAVFQAANAKLQAAMTDYKVPRSKAEKNPINEPEEREKAMEEEKQANEPPKLSLREKLELLRKSKQQ